MKVEILYFIYVDAMLKYAHVYKYVSMDRNSAHCC